MQEGIIKYFILPSETTEVELNHVRKINKIALKAVLLHIPLFVLVAYLCGTSIFQAVAFGSMLAAGPVIANATLSNPRLLSLVYGFTTMCLGALLVHLGQGPAQIEMHFHFFASLALLSVWGNPLIIWVATVTVAIHHFAFWMFLIDSVFNYPAEFWVVAIHAIFVVVESVAAAFIARNFFDNVIGLDKIVRERTAQLDEKAKEMQLILDNTAQGFMTINPDGKISHEKSSILSNWFGDIPEGAVFCEHFSTIDSEFGGLLEFSFSDLEDGVLPLEYCLESLPSTLKLEGSVFEFTYTAIEGKSEDRFEHLLVVVSDITLAIEKEKSDLIQLETIGIFQNLLRDQSGFLEFVRSTDRTIEQILDLKKSGKDNEIVARDLHTIKGNCGVFAISSIANLIHQIESRMLEEGGKLVDVDADRLVLAWSELKERLKQFVQEETGAIEILEEDLSEVIKLSMSETNHTKLIHTLKSWRHESMRSRLSRIREQALSIAKKLNKTNIEVKVEDHGVRLPVNKWFKFWSVFGHIIRNSVDHGIEDSKAREKLGKAPTGNLYISTQIENDSLVIRVEDDGSGIDWDTLKENAIKKGHVIDGKNTVEDLLFVDGVTSKDVATAFSGRGVGMAAVRNKCIDLGGKIKVDSRQGLGTKIEFVFDDFNADEEVESTIDRKAS